MYLPCLLLQSLAWTPSALAHLAAAHGSKALVPSPAFYILISKGDLLVQRIWQRQKWEIAIVWQYSIWIYDEVTSHDIRAYRNGKDSGRLKSVCFRIAGKLGYGQLGLRFDAMEQELQRFRRLLANQWLKYHFTNSFLCLSQRAKEHNHTWRLWKCRGPTAKGLDNADSAIAEDLPVENTCMMHVLCYKGKENFPFCAISLCWIDLTCRDKI